MSLYSRTLILLGLCAAYRFRVGCAHEEKNFDSVKDFIARDASEFLKSLAVKDVEIDPQKLRKDSAVGSFKDYVAIDGAEFLAKPTDMNSDADEVFDPEEKRAAEEEEVQLEEDSIRGENQPQLVKNDDAKVIESAIGARPLLKEKFYNKFDFLKLFSGLYYQQTYYTINDYLVDNVDSLDTEKNLAAALDLLDKETKKGVDMFNRNLVEALKQFTALATIQGENKCNQDSYAILWKNDRATQRRAHKRFSKLKLPLRRIDSLVYKYSMQHAIDCHYIYQENYAKILERMDKNMVKRVEGFMNEVIRQKMKKKNSFFFGMKTIQDDYFDPLSVIKKVKKISGDTIGDIAYDAISMFAQEDPDRVYLKKIADEKTAKMYVNRDKVRQLVKKHLVEPCEYYQIYLGPDVFYPARFDIRMFETEDRYRNSNEKIEFFTAWTRFELCTMLIYKDQEALVSDVVNVARKKPYQQ